MNLTITTLGTSHGDPTRERFNASTLVEMPDCSLLIDCGTPALAQLRRCGKDLRRIRHLVITHMHEDHFGGLPDLLKYQSKRMPADYQLTIWLPEAEAEKPIRDFYALAHRPLLPGIQFHLIQPGILPVAENFTLEALPTDHFSNEGLAYPSYALLLTIQNKRLLFTGDLSRDFHDFPKNIPADLAFCELTHYDLEKALPTLASQSFGKLVFTHVGDEWHGKENESRWQSLASRLPYPTHLAHDLEQFLMTPPSSKTPCIRGKIA